MSDSAEIPQTETPVTAPESLPAQGGETPAAPAPAEEAAPAASQQTPQMIPKWRFDEVNEQLKAERLARAQHQQPAPQQQQPGNPNQAPKPEDFGDDFQAYQDARAAWIADQRYEQRRAAERQQEQTRSVQERLMKADDDWENSYTEAVTKNPTLAQKLQNAPSLTRDAQYMLKESDKRIELAEYLADNPVTVFNINKLIQQGRHDLALREFGRIEGKLAGSTGQPPPRKPSAGVPDMQPVGAGNKPGAIDPYDPNTSVEDYVRATRPPPKRR